MKIYTGTGDRGRTGLFSGERVDKHDLRLSACGDLDELSACLGLLVSRLKGAAGELGDEIRAVQGDLLNAGSWLTTTPTSPAAESLPPFPESRIADLEAAIDRMTADLPPLRRFILPGGDDAAAVAHLARTVCRRAERRATALVAADKESGSTPRETVLVYLNRLSDYLFVLARHINRLAGREDVTWPS